MTIGTTHADYLCMTKDGTTSAYQNLGGLKFSYVPQIKDAEGHDRANIRYADIDGDVNQSASDERFV